MPPQSGSNDKHAILKVRVEVLGEKFSSDFAVLKLRLLSDTLVLIDDAPDHGHDSRPIRVQSTVPRGTCPPGIDPYASTVECDPTILPPEESPFDLFRRIVTDARHIDAVDDGPSTGRDRP
jgi:hypothetical protein